MTEDKKETVVQSVYDAINDTTATIAVGTVEKVLVKRINEDGSPSVTTFKDAATGQQKTINNTHRYALLLSRGEDKTWISFGSGEVKNLNYENKFQIKDKESNKYIDILKGMEIRLPVIEESFKRKDDTTATVIKGKKNKIKITSESGVVKDDVPTPSKGRKIYGEIVTVAGNKVSVKTEDGEHDVTLNDDQLSQIVDGGRLTGIRLEDGTITSGFKAYGPKASKGGNAESKAGSRFKKDNSGMETGHAINGALNLVRKGLSDAPVVEIAKVIHDVTKSLKEVFKNLESTKGMSEYDIGAMVGHAVLNATRDIEVTGGDTPSDIYNKLEEYSTNLMNDVVPLVSAYVKGETPVAKENNEKEPELKPKKEDKQVANESGHVDMSPPEIDFDDDVPF